LGEFEVLYMPKILFAYIISVFVALNVVCQTTGNVKSDVVLKYKKSADRHYEKGDYSIAMKEYATVVQYYMNDPVYNFRYGVCILEASYHKESAIPFFQTAINWGNIEAVKMMGLTHHDLYKFEEALKYYQEYISLSDTDSRKYKNSNIKRLISNTSTAKELVETPVNVQITNLGSKINSEYADYVPIVTADDEEIFYTSKRPSSTGGNLDENAEFYEDIFYSGKDSLKNWQHSRHILGNLNSHHHDAVAGLSADGQTLIIYQNDLYGHGGDLLISYLRDTIWSNPKLLSEEISRKDSWEPSASLTANEDALYFSSDRPGGFGGLDLYISKRLPNGNYGEPKNLGSTINSTDNEDAPFISADGKVLYFSSKGHKNMGGYDVFKSEKQINGYWGSPENMGYPINTTDDDVFFTINAEGTHGYYASLAADSYGEKDIYMIKFSPKPKTLAVLKGKVSDLQNKPVASQIFINKTNNNKLNGLYNSNASTGKYLIVLQPGFSYEAVFKAEGYFDDSLFINAEEFEGFSEVIKNIKLRKLRDKLLDSVKSVPKEMLIIGKKEVLKKAIKLDTMASNSPKMMLVDTNGNQKQMNREKIEQDSIIDKSKYAKVVSIDLSDTNKAKPHQPKPNFTKDCQIDFTDSVHVLSFNFGYKKSDLSNEQYQVLDSIITPLKNKIKGIKINTHTDNVGSVRYNLILSQLRSIAIVSHLKAKGIKTARIAACFYGESRPIFPNANADGSDNTENRYKNRRVEIGFFVKE